MSCARVYSVRTLGHAEIGADDQDKLAFFVARCKVMWVLLSRLTPLRILVFGRQVRLHRRGPMFRSSLPEEAQRGCLANKVPAQSSDDCRKNHNRYGRR